MITDRKQLEQWLNTNRHIHDLSRCSIGYDGLINAIGNVALHFKNGETSLPVTFGRIQGVFDVSCCPELDTFEGFPHTCDSWIHIQPTRIMQLSGIDKAIRRLARINVNYDATHLLNLFLVEGLTSIRFAGYTNVSGSARSSFLQTLYEDHRRNGDVLTFQDALLDAGYVDEARW